jgi:NAD(P)H-flavin reductase/hemoglobin-like flavoprotein
MQCKTHRVAIALDSGVPEGNPSGIFAGQPLWSAFNRRTNGPSSRSASIAETALDSHPPASPQSVPERSWQLGSQEQGSAGNEHSANHISGFHARLVKESFAAIETRAQEAMEHFYAWLFVQHPEIRAMFPLGMSEQRDRVFSALARIVWSLDSPEALSSYAGQLGRDHRKFAVKDKHYEAFFGALLGTVRYFSADAWTADTQAAWEAALGSIAAIMRAAAAADAGQAPAWWLGEVVEHDLRGPDLAVLTIRLDQPLRYLPGQYLSVQVGRWPRVWRNYSVANAPRADGLLDLHVRAVRGGMVSTALVHHSQPGDALLLGPARGDMTISEDCDRDLLCIAGGTGLAPVKALIEAAISAAGQARQPKIALYLGARDAGDLYDMPDLARLEACYPLLDVVPVVASDPDWQGLTGLLPDAVRQHAACEDREVFISGPGAMVTQTVRMLARRVPGERIHHDPLDVASA